ncbi:unnamed protein product, partial [Urochloa humidicola]
QKIQICQKNNYHNIGFIDPEVVYEDNVKRKSCDVVDLIYRNLRKNSMCPFILLPYCHHFHWILFAIEIETTGYGSTTH